MMNRCLILLFFTNLSRCFSNDTNITGKGAWAYSNEIQIRCVSAQSFVKLSNGEMKLINEIRTGDRILTMEKSQIISTEFMFMLDQHSLKQALFYKIRTKSGHEISLTKYHLIGIESSNENFHFKFAKDIKKDDYLYISHNEQIQCSPVVNITIEIQQGFYSPLTIDGTMLINEILISSYAHVQDHDQAQMIFFPLRSFYRIISFFNYQDRVFNENSKEGLHWMISFLFHWTRTFRSEVLFL